MEAIIKALELKNQLDQLRPLTIDLEKKIMQKLPRGMVNYIFIIENIILFLVT